MDVDLKTFQKRFVHIFWPKIQFCASVNGPYDAGSELRFRCAVSLLADVRR